MEQDVQLHRGLSREVLKHGWLPRLRNVARRFAERSFDLCPSALCCSRSSSSSSGITRTTQQPNATMNKVLSESYRNICLPQFMTAEETPSPVKSPYKDHRSTTMKAKCYSSDDDHPSTLARMSSSSTSTDELHCPQSGQSVDDFSAAPTCRVRPTSVKKDFTVNTVDCATQYETVDVDSAPHYCPVSVMKHTTASSTHILQTATSSTQAGLPLTSTGTQHDLKTRELAIQATHQTKSLGIQCAHEMVSASTQAGPSVQSAGVQVMADMVNSASQAAVVTKNSGTQAVHETKTQGTQYEVVSVTRLTQTEEQCQTEDTSPANLREEIVCLVQKFIHNDSKVLKLDKFIDVEDKVRQFLDIMEDTYKESPPEPESESHPSHSAASDEMAPSVHETQESTSSSKSPNAPASQQVAGTFSALGMSQSDTGLIYQEDLQQEDDYKVQPLVSLPSFCSTRVEDILGEDGRKPEGRRDQDSSGSMVRQRCEAATRNKDPGCVLSLTGVLSNTRNPRQQEKDEESAKNFEHSAHSGLPVSSQCVQQIPPDLHTGNIPDSNIANGMDGLPSSYFNTLADIGSFWRECSSGQTTRPHIPDQRSNQCGPVILPTDSLRSQASTISDNQDDSKVSHAQSVTLVYGAGSLDIWGEIEEAMEGCGEPEMSNQQVDAEKSEEGESFNSHRDIPLPGTYRLTESLSIPGFALLNHDIPDRMGHALYLRGGVKSDGDKDCIRYDFDWDEAIDFSQTCELAPRPSENSESHPRDLQQHVNSFAVHLNQVLQQVKDSARGSASCSAQGSGFAEGTKNFSLESFTFVNNEERKGSNSCNSNMVASDDAAPTLMHVEDFWDAQHTPEAADIEDGWVDVQEVKFCPANRQPSQEGCENRTTTNECQTEGSAAEGGAVGGFTVECFQPGFYQDADGYQVPNNEVPLIGNDDIEEQLRDDGSKWILGSGSFGTVEAAFYRSPAGPVLEVAVKRYLWENRDAVIREGKMMEFLQKTGVFPKFYGFVNDEDSQAICLVSELFARGTTLADIMHGASYYLEPVDWMNICVQLAKGLRKIHEMQVIFNDLKENNILVDISSQPAVKFIDLGISTFRQGISYDFTAEELRPLRHIAPEVKHGAPTSFLSDIWGLGILLLDIATVSGVPGLEHVAAAALAENPEQRVCLDGITAALVAILTSQNLHLR